MSANGIIGNPTFKRVDTIVHAIAVELRAGHEHMLIEQLDRVAPSFTVPVIRTPGGGQVMDYVLTLSRMKGNAPDSATYGYRKKLIDKCDSHV